MNLSIVILHAINTAMEEFLKRFGNFFTFLITNFWFRLSVYNLWPTGQKYMRWINM